MKYIILFSLFISSYVFADDIPDSCFVEPYCQYSIAIDHDGWDYVYDTVKYNSVDAACAAYVGYPWFYREGIKYAKYSREDDSLGCITAGKDGKYDPWLSLPLKFYLPKKPNKCFSNQEMGVDGLCHCKNPDDVLTSDAQCLPRDCKNSAKDAFICFKDDINNALYGLNIQFNKFDIFDEKLQQALKQKDDPKDDDPKDGDPKDDDPKDDDPKDDDPKDDDVDLSSLKGSLPIIKNNQAIKFLFDLFPTKTDCPSDNFIELLGNSFTFSYSRLCVALVLIGDLIMIISLIIAYRILRSI